MREKERDSAEKKKQESLGCILETSENLDSNFLHRKFCLRLLMRHATPSSISILLETQLYGSHFTSCIYLERVSNNLIYVARYHQKHPAPVPLTLHIVTSIFDFTYFIVDKKRERKRRQLHECQYQSYEEGVGENEGHWGKNEQKSNNDAEIVIATWRSEVPLNFQFHNSHK